MDKYTVEIQPDLIQRLARTDPIRAVAELIWNGFDSDASNVSVALEYDDLGMMTKILVNDDGDGIPYKNAPVLFQRLGGSWKKPGSKSERGRFLHGYEGRGRYKALSLGRVVDWQVSYRREDGTCFEYTITILEANTKEFRISEERESSSKKTGVTVTISELERQFRSLEEDDTAQHFAEIFALYLKDYSEASLEICGVQIDPTSAIHESVSYSLSSPSDDEDMPHTAILEIIEWKNATHKSLYLCSENGFPLSKAVERRFHTADFRFSAYLKSTYITELNRTDQLELGDMLPELSNLVEEAQQKIRRHFLNRSARAAKSVVDEWKDEEVYPYKGDARTKLEEVERQVFDIVAVTANDYTPDFRVAPKRQKAMYLHTLKAALKNGPEDIQRIITEVLDLPARKQTELAQLLEDVSLSGIINAAKMVGDRLKFLDGIEGILFNDDTKRRLKERSQLHRILAEETWFFGEEFNLTIDDQGLTNVLRKHAKSQNLDVAIDKPVLRVDGRRGVVDLMLSRSYRTHRPDETEHLVVELKAPTVKVGSKEIDQIRDYAFAVAEDERFRSVNTKWHFWIVSNEMDRNAQRQARQSNLPRGVVYQADDQDITIWAKTWGQVLEENASRLKFFQESLEHRADQGKGIKHLSQRYRSFLEGVIEVTEAADDSSDGKQRTAAE